MKRARPESAATGLVPELNPSETGNKHRLSANCKTLPGQLTFDVTSYQIRDSCTKAETDNETELMCSESFTKSEREGAREANKSTASFTGGSTLQWHVIAPDWKAVISTAASWEGKHREAAVPMLSLFL